MKEIVGKIIKGMSVVILALIAFVATIFYEQSVSYGEYLAQTDQLSLEFSGQTNLEIERDGEALNLRTKDLLLEGDLIKSYELEDVLIHFAQDGELRLNKNAEVLIKTADLDRSEFVFELLAGEVWLNNLYSNAEVNLQVAGAVVKPEQSILYLNKSEGRTLVYSNANNSMVNFVAIDDESDDLLERVSERVINKLLLPQGTQLTVFENKIANNPETIGLLLYSKLIKEFQYSVFDSSQLRRNAWLNKNVSADQLLAVKVKNVRLENIRTRGLKYNDLGEGSAKLNEAWLKFSNNLVFREDVRLEKMLNHWFEYLYDSQYLFDINNVTEAQARLNDFKSGINQLLLSVNESTLIGQEFKEEFLFRIKKEYDYLSFLTPNENLFGLKLALEGLYLEELDGDERELEIRFEMLTNQLNNLNYFAFNNQARLVQIGFEEYVSVIRNLLNSNRSALTENYSLVQQQNQLLDNLFTQYAEFYSLEYFAGKIYIENQYLALLPNNNDKYEEIQTMINQRINFLLNLENFFLNGQVSVQQAQNIVALLIDKIGELELPSNMQAAVGELFNQRLSGFRDFYRFLNSPEYVSSGVRSGTLRERFEQFKKDSLSNGAVDNRSVTDLLRDEGLADLGVEAEREEEVVDVDEVDVEDVVDVEREKQTEVERPRVPRVRPNN